MLLLHSQVAGSSGKKCLFPALYCEPVILEKRDLPPVLCAMVTVRMIAKRCTVELLLKSIQDVTARFMASFNQKLSIIPIVKGMQQL